MSEQPPVAAGPRKKAATVVWSVVVVGFILLFFAAIMGPKFMAMKRVQREHAARQDGGVTP